MRTRRAVLLTLFLSLVICTLLAQEYDFDIPEEEESKLEFY